MLLTRGEWAYLGVDVDDPAGGDPDFQDGPDEDPVGRDDGDAGGDDL
jgi:hypothetical protein